MPATMVTLRTQEGEYEAHELCSYLLIGMDHHSGHCTSAPPVGDVRVTVAPLSFPSTVAALILTLMNNSCLHGRVMAW